MIFKLSSRSEARLEGLDPRLIAVVKSAIHKTKIDFGVICGMRTLDEQKELVAKGASQTMKSKHLQGYAVDLMAYIGSRGSWELNLYDDLADAMAEAARVLIGPALIALTLIPFAPRSLAKYLTLASRADLQTPMTL